MDLNIQPGLRRLTLPGAPEYTPPETPSEPGKPVSAPTVMSKVTPTVRQDPRPTQTQSEPYAPDIWERYPTPQDVPIDDFFPQENYRKYQRETIVDILTTFFPVEKGGKGKRFCIVEAPTGSGKSAECITLAEAAPSSYLATSQRMLQDQYARDFVKISMEKVYNLKPMPDEDAEVDALRQWFKESIRTAAKGSLENVTTQISALWSAAQADNLETQIQFMNKNRDAVILLKGKNNYNCQRYGTEAGPEFTCGNAPCTTDPNQAISKLIKAQCVSQGVCPYFIERTRAVLAKKTLVNFKNLILLSMLRVFKRRSLLLIDECHTLESTLFSFVEIDITERALNPVLGSLTIEQRELLTEGIESDEDMLAFLQGVVQPAVRREISFLESGGLEGESAEEDIDSNDDTDVYQQLVKLNYKITFLLELVAEGGSVVLTPNIVESKLNFTKKVQDGYKLKPLSVAQMFQKVFAPGRQVLLTSATILDHVAFCNTLGIPLEEVEFVRVPSTFPAENSPFLFRPIGSMGFRDIGRTLPLLGEEIKRLLEKHKDVKGLIHTVNFTPITTFLYEFLGGRNNPRLIFHMPDTNKFEAIRRHMESKEPTVLIGPGFMEGLDLKDELSRFQIFCKVPYLSMADPVVKKRMTLDPRWYSWMCALQILQGQGRSIRSETDHAVSYMLDSNFENFWRNSRDILPAHFRSQVMWDD